MKQVQEMTRELNIAAQRENLSKVLRFVNDCMDCYCREPLTRLAMNVAVEEIFINIASYAYEPASGEAWITFRTLTDRKMMEFTFADAGYPFDPLQKAAPDINVPVEKRRVGGLGIYMVRKSMDEIFYEYKDDRNILTIRKRYGRLPLLRHSADEKS